MSYVYSTMTNAHSYNVFADTPKGGVPTILRSIVIKGGANLHTKDTIVTPMGVATKVSLEDLEILEKNVTFIEQKKLGYISISKAKKDADKVAETMTPKDKSAPMTPQTVAAPFNEETDAYKMPVIKSSIR